MTGLIFIHEDGVGWAYKADSSHPGSTLHSPMTSGCPYRMLYPYVPSEEAVQGGVLCGAIGVAQGTAHFQATPLLRVLLQQPSQ